MKTLLTPTNCILNKYEERREQFWVHKFLKAGGDGWGGGLTPI